MNSCNEHVKAKRGLALTLQCLQRIHCLLVRQQDMLVPSVIIYFPRILAGVAVAHIYRNTTFEYEQVSLTLDAAEVIYFYRFPDVPQSVNVVSPKLHFLSLSTIMALPAGFDYWYPQSPSLVVVRGSIHFQPKRHSTDEQGDSA